MISRVRFGIRRHTLRSGVDLDYCLLNQPNTGFGEILIRHACRMRLGMAEHHVELGEAEHKMIALVDKGDLDRLAQGIRQ